MILNTVSSLRMQLTLFVLALSVTICNAGLALEVDVAQSSQYSVSRKNIHIDTNKLIGMNRSAILELLGQPLGSDEFFPESRNSNIVDSYLLKSNTEKKLRISYSRECNASAADIESQPYAAPKFMGEKCKKVRLTEAKLQSLLHEIPEEKWRQMKAVEITQKLGSPDRSWQETARAGNRDWHFLNYLYFLSTDGRKAFVIRFNEDNHSVYEYRLQSLGL